MQGEIAGKELRKKLRDKYLQSPADSMSDRELLELFLFYASPRGNVPQIADDLIDHFGGNFSRVFTAEPPELCKIDGITDNSSVLLHLVGDVRTYICLQKNKSITKLSDIKTAKAYAYNEISKLNYERIILITLDSDNSIINCNTVADGTVNLASVEEMKLVRCAIEDKAQAIIIAHNHPHGASNPSRQDVQFTNHFCKLAKSIGIKTLDHLVVGKDDVCSMREIDELAYMFSGEGECYG